MNLPDLKELEKVIALCRKRGVKSIKIDNVEIQLGDTVPESNYKKSKKANHGVTDKVESDDLTSEQLMFYSVQDDLATKDTN